MCCFAWDLYEYEMFVLSGNVELVAIRESYIQLSPMFRSNSVPLHAAFDDKRYIPQTRRAGRCLPTVFKNISFANFANGIGLWP
jgi:hypothetical protein